MANYELDPVHSSLEFKIKHLMVSTVRGTFDNYDIKVNGDINDLSSLNIEVTIDASSINTKNEQRDEHLRSADFFNVDNNKNITFKSTNITNDKITGDLTINGQTHEETFDFEPQGVSKNPMDGSQRTGVIVTGKINRNKYGVSFNQTLETGGVMLGEDVKFEANPEFTITE